MSFEDTEIPQESIIFYFLLALLPAFFFFYKNKPFLKNSIIMQLSNKIWLRVGIWKDYRNCKLCPVCISDWWNLNLLLWSIYNSRKSEWKLENIYLWFQEVKSYCLIKNMKWRVSNIWGSPLTKNWNSEDDYMEGHVCSSYKQCFLNRSSGSLVYHLRPLESISQ